MYTHVFLMTAITPWYMSDHYVTCNDECTHMCYWWKYLHHFVCKIPMSDVMMNIHTCLTDTTTYTMLYVRSLCLTQWGMYTHALLITLLTPWYDVCEITMSNVMLNVHTCVTDKLLTPCYISDQYISFNYECVTDNIAYIMLYVSSIQTVIYTSIETSLIFKYKSAHHISFGYLTTL